MLECIFNCDRVLFASNLSKCFCASSNPLSLAPANVAKVRVESNLPCVLDALAGVAPCRATPRAASNATSAGSREGHLKRKGCRRTPAQIRVSRLGVKNQEGREPLLWVNATPFD